MPYRSCSHPDELLFLKVGGHTLFLVAKVRNFDGPVVFRGKRYIPVMPDLIGHLYRYCPAWSRPRLQKNRPAEHPACKRGRLLGENHHFPLHIYSQKHSKWQFCVNAASPSCPTCHRHARPDAIVMPDLIGHLSNHEIYGKRR